MAKKKRSDREILKLTDKFYKELIEESPNQRDLPCRFRGKGDRFCLASTHKTCFHCKFFEPTVMAKFETLLRHLEQLKNENAGLRKKLANRELEIVMLQAELAELKVELEGVKNEQDSDGEQPESIASGKENDAGAVSEEN